MKASSAAVRGRRGGQLVAAVKAGDRTAAERLVEETYEMVFASLVKLTGGDRDLAADLTQETYRRAWQSLDRFDGRSKFGTWLYRIAYNAFLNHVRRPARIRPFEEGEAEAAEDTAPDLRRRAEERQQEERLRRAVLDLPEDLRFAVTARYWSDASATEIAKIQGISAVAVRKRLRKAYAALGIALEATP
ncbi:MAG: sigma-70 family RNA polymerase sigma factor [Acidobacteriota bacterium]